MMIFTGLTASIAGLAGADVIDVRVTVENLAPEFGTYQTPFWVGFHNGGWDGFNAGSGASAALERLAEDGNVSPFSDMFNASGNGALDGFIPGPDGVYAPGGIASAIFSIDTDDPQARYFSFASMVIPSNDAFVGNDDPLAHQIFGKNGKFLGADFFLTGANVWDAGSEFNDEIPENTAFFGQTEANTGVTENGVIRQHAGYIGSFGNPGGTQSILADPQFAGADFTLPGYPIARITISAVPAPGALALLGFAGVFGKPRRRRGVTKG